MILSRISPLTRCFPVYVYNSRSQYEIKIVKAAEECLKEVGYTLKKIDLNDYEKGYDNLAGLRLNLKNEDRFPLPVPCRSEVETSEGKLAKYKELLILDYMLKKNVNTILLPGDFQDYLSKIVPAIAEDSMSSYDAFKETTIKRYFPHDCYHPMKYDIISLMPLLHSPRHELIAYGKELFSKQTSIIDAIEIYRKQSKAVSKSDRYYKNFLSASKTVYENSVKIEKLLNDVEDLRDVIEYVDDFCEKTSKKLLEGFNNSLSTLKIPLYILNDTDKMDIYKEYTNTYKFRIAANNLVTYLSNALFTITLSKILKYVSPVNLTNNDCENLNKYIKNMGMEITEDSRSFISDSLRCKAINPKTKTFDASIYIARGYKDYNYIFSTGKCTDDYLTIPIKVNEVICWNNTFYICILMDKIEVFDEGFDATIQKLKNAHIKENFCNFKFHADLVPADAVSSEFFKKSANLTTRLENIKFIVRPINKSDLITICDTVTHLLKNINLDSSVGSNSFTLSSLCKSLLNNEHNQFPTLHLRYPLIEASIEDTYLKKTNRFIIAAPSVGLNFVTPNIQVLQAHYSTFKYGLSNIITNKRNPQ